MVHGAAETDTDADPRTRSRATTHAAAATTAASPRTIAATAASRRARSAQRTLARDDELGRDRLEVERRPARVAEAGAVAVLGAAGAARRHARTLTADPAAERDGAAVRAPALGLNLERVAAALL